MKKSTYIFICLLLSIQFWQLSFLPNFLSSDVFLVVNWIWALMAYLLFRGKPRLNSIYSFKYTKIMYWIFMGVFISMLSAYFFWQQNFEISFIAQRGIYSFILLPAILYVQPTEEDIFKSIKWISFGVILAWVLSIIDPSFIGSIDQEVIEQRQNSNITTDIGFSVAGVKFVLFFLYYILYKLSKQYSSKLFFTSLLLFLFIVLYQNRSMLIGAILAYIIVIWKIKSKNKFFFYPALSLIITCIIIWTVDIWSSLLNETIHQINDTDYNRWKALHYYIFEYSPNWFCSLFGNGFPSGGNSKLGSLMWSNFNKGIYASDIGMIGMWTSFGIIPLIFIYAVIFRILIKKIYPLYLKLLALHISLVPIFFHFWKPEGIIVFILLIYLFAYYTEQNKSKNCAFNYNRQLQERTKNN